MGFSFEKKNHFVWYDNIWHSLTLRVFFPKCIFASICLDIIYEITISQEHNVQFQNFCTKTELKEEPFRKKQKKKTNFEHLTQLDHYKKKGHLLI